MVCTRARNAWASPNDSSSWAYRDYPSVEACVSDANSRGYGHVQRCECVEESAPACSPQSKNYEGRSYTLECDGTVIYQVDRFIDEQSFFNFIDREDDSFIKECGAGYKKVWDIYPIWSHCEPTEATCEELGNCPPVPVPTTPPPGDACPRGDAIPLSAVTMDLWGNPECPEGYYADIISPANPFTFTPSYGSCVCEQAKNQPEIRKKGREGYEKQQEGTLTGSLSKLMEMLPQLLIVMVVVSIIGAFKR